MSAQVDALTERYPLHVKSPAALKMSRQAELFYGDLQKNEASLQQNGFSFGASRLAVRVSSDERGPGCVYCGLCLYGCPYELIFNAASLLPRLQKNANFKYLSGIFVDKITESSAGVEISGRHYADQRSWRMSGARVFLGGGVLSSARILLNSMESPAPELTVKSNQHFLLPLLRFSTVPAVSREGLHTLSQLYIEYETDSSSQNQVHLQVYTYNDLFAGERSNVSWVRCTA